MTRPGIITYAFGNALSVTVLVAATCYLGYQWYTGNVAGFFVLVLGLVTISAGNANSRLTRYRDWKREWDAMEGRAPSRSFFPISGRVARWLVGIPAWLLFGYLALTSGNGAGNRVAAMLFWLATVVGIVGSLIQWWRSRSTKRSPVGSKDVPVTLCVKAAGQSADLSDAYRALPTYCASLIARRSP
jgi:hypothetical protein